MTEQPPVRYHHPDSRVVCMICWQRKRWEDLEPVSDAPNQRWDVCKDCAARDKQSGAVY
jgi:hypothetical protein